MTQVSLSRRDSFVSAGMSCCESPNETAEWPQMHSFGDCTVYDITHHGSQR